eukprot:TRINITY_DN123109_c0_g1_i1.p1 TRINITY_DN123109_c0_g1~~TRINITY_DN123109_c0_g1_i1.p1  ORF type:complete len:381 (-),score=68.16 TRINITY_DN123109_c0_g1_i1:72-1142(-)
MGVPRRSPLPRHRLHRFASSGLILVGVSTAVLWLNQPSGDAFVGGSLPQASSPHVQKGRVTPSSLIQRLAEIVRGEPPAPEELVIPEKLKDLTGEPVLKYPAPKQGKFNIFDFPDPMLRRTNVDVTEFDTELEDFVTSLRRTARDVIGVSAPQVGVNKRIMVMNVDDYCKENKIVLDPSDPEKTWGDLVFINPKIVGYSSEESYVVVNDVTQEESYASKLEEMKGVITRPNAVFITSVDTKGEPVKTKLDIPFMARVFQQLYDHLNGVLLVDRFDPRIREGFQPTLDKLTNRYMYKLQVAYDMMGLNYTTATSADVEKTYKDAKYKYDRDTATEDEQSKLRQIESGYKDLKARLGL